MSTVDLFTTLGQVFAAPLGWFVDCLAATTLTDVYLAFVFISLAVALLLKPLRGDGTSKKSKVGDD